MLLINKKQLDNMLTELEQTDLSSFYKTDTKVYYTIQFSKYVLYLLFIAIIILLTVTWGLIIAIPWFIEFLYKEYINDKRSNT